jgi:prepilin-type N-terminal cleavage/methylation domain-containing protein
MLNGARLRRESGQRGFSMLELLVTLVLLGLVGTAIVTILWRQQRFYSSASEVLLTREQIRQAAFMLPADLRGLSRIEGDIYAMSDSSIEFRSTFGTSAMCLYNSGSSYITTVPLKLLSNAAMTSWKVPPIVNDSVAVYDENVTTAAKDDIWRVYRITKVVQVIGNVMSGCPTVSGLVTAADMVAGNPSYQLTISPAPSKTHTAGAAIRMFRKVHYSLFKSSADGKWYLGFYDCLPNRVPVCANIQPIAGPLRPYATDGTSGLQLSYYDSTGAVTANRALVSRISLVARAEGEAKINLAGGKLVPLRDSLRVEVSLRNRN